MSKKFLNEDDDGVASRLEVREVADAEEGRCVSGGTCPIPKRRFAGRWGAVTATPRPRGLACCT